MTKALNSAKQLCRPEFSSPYQRDSSVTKVSDLLFELGRGPEAEELFHEDILAASKVVVPPHESYLLSRPNKALLGLVALYGKAARWDDILLLLEAAPQWGAADLIDIIGDSPDSGDDHGVDVPVGVEVARALSEKGRTAEA